MSQQKADKEQFNMIYIYIHMCPTAAVTRIRPDTHRHIRFKRREERTNQHDTRIHLDTHKHIRFKRREQKKEQISMIHTYYVLVDDRNNQSIPCIRTDEDREKKNHHDASLYITKIRLRTREKYTVRDIKITTIRPCTYRHVVGGGDSPQVAETPADAGTVEGSPRGGGFEQGAESSGFSGC